MDHNKKTKVLDKAPAVLVALASTKPVAAGELPKLPELPPTHYNGYSDGSEPLWTAEQVHDYATAYGQQCAAIRPVDGRTDGGVAKSEHPNLKVPIDAACSAKLDDLGDDRGQGLDPYWKSGFRSGWHYATLAASAAQPAASYWQSQRKMVERAIVGLRDGWATRKDADDALAVLAPAAQVGAVPDDVALLDFLGGPAVVSMHQYEPSEGVPYFAIDLDLPGSPTVRGSTLRAAIDAAMKAHSSPTQPAGGEHACWSCKKPYTLERALSAEAKLSAVQAGAVPDGWQLVPVEMTPEMDEAMSIARLRVGNKEVWDDVLAAAPTQPAGGEQK